jgi:predicted outer membrane repeat protein
MQRKLLAATVAAGPLLALALSAPSGAWAQTTITTATTTPIATATANAGQPSDVILDAAGTITLAAPGPAITLNSNNNVTVSGAIATKEVSDSTGVLAIGGNTGNITVGSGINLLSDYQATDSDNDGDLDGAFATGANRFGIRVIGPGVFNGNISLVNGGAINASGADSAGISVETDLNGAFTISGSATLVGERVYGVRAAGRVTGPVRIEGAISVTGLNATGVALDGDLGSSLVFQGAVTATGFRYTSRPPLDTQRAGLEADDKLLGGPAVRIGGNVARGILFDVAQAPDITDANADGVGDNPDLDGDGVADLLEGSTIITAYGSAPAVLIGGATAATTIGQISGSAYGIYNKGTITADGVLDGFAATAIQIGRGQPVNIAGGIGNAGTINATSYFANSTALLLNSGVSTPTLYNSGAIIAATTSDSTHTARALSVQAGATTASLTNTGTLSAAVSGSKGDAIAFEDLSGAVRSVENSGRITAAVVGESGVTTTGKAIALDLRAAAGDVTVHQDHAQSTVVAGENDTDKDGVNDIDEPQILGDVLFGAGNDKLLLANGSLSGAISFGAGADLLSITGGASATGALTDSDGRLTIDVSNGTLSLSNATTINATSLNVGANSGLRFTADPANNTATRIVVGSATLAPGAKVDMTLASILDTPTRYTVIQAGTLNVGNLSSTLSGSPYLYLSSASANAALGQVYVDVRPRTATELGFRRSEAQAYDAVIQALKKDTPLAAPLLAQTTSEGLNRLYDQLLPEQGQGLFDALAYSNGQLSQAISQKPDLFDRYGPDSVWVHEVNTLVRQENGDTLGSDTQVFGFTGGYEAMGEYGGALGVALSYMNVQERDNAAQVGERTTASFVEGMAYWRRSMGGFRVAVGGGGGYGWMQADRRFFSGDLNADGVNDLARENSADWNGVLGQAFTSVAYEQAFGRYYLRPEGRLDYLYLNEGARKETGGGAGFDLNVAKRSSSTLDGLAALTFGATFGHDLWWRPEIRVGYRQRLAGSMGATVANFGGGSPFRLTAENEKDGALTFDMALRAGTPMSYVAVEGGVAAAKRTKRYNVRLAGRMMF